MRRQRALLKTAMFVLCGLPLVTTLLRASGVAGLTLGANPVDELIDEFGSWGLRLLLLTLCVTPASSVLRKPWILSVRRMVGLYAFTYLALHFSTWLVIDQSLALDAVLADIVRRPYIAVGFTAFVLLLPLAVTSTAGWMRRLGRRWHVLHRLVYLIAVLGCIHYWWQVKADWREPLLYSCLLAALLGWRALRRWRSVRGTTRAVPDLGSNGATARELFKVAS